MPLVVVVVVVVVVLEGVVYTGGGGVWEPWDGGGSCHAATVFACFVPKARHVNNREGGPPPGTQGAVTLLHSSDEILYWLRVVNREEVRGRGESP